MHCKHKLYNGTQLILVGRDGNLNNVRMACALVPSETEGHVFWFLNVCVEAGIDMTGPVVSDRGAGIIAAGRRFDLDFKHCTMHIVRTIVHNFPRNFQEEEHTPIIWDIQKAVDENEYKSHLAVLGVCCGASVKA
ncbi:hypothetical protein PINS_up013411 [Pythium insidiosum]|nr:hypothetical protein PINS_up013411 [Pythium insidiosum]